MPMIDLPLCFLLSDAETCFREKQYAALERGSLMTTKKPVCYRLSDEVIRCLDQLEQSCGDYRSRTDIVERAIIHEWEKRLGLAVPDQDRGLLA